MKNKLTIKKLDLIYYLLSFLMRLFFTFSMAISTIYFIYRGISLTSISIYVSIATFVSIISDIPLGIISDKISQKYIYIFGLLLVSIENIIYTNVTQDYILYIAGAINGIGAASISGVLEAWYINTRDEIDPNNPPGSGVFTFLQGLLNNAAAFGLIIGAIIATFISFDMVFYVRSIGFFLIALISFFIIKKERVKGESNLEKISILINFDKYLEFLRNINFMKMLLFCSITGIVWGGFSVIWMPSLKEIFSLETNSIIQESIMYFIVYLFSGIIIILINKRVTLLFHNMIIFLVVLRIIFGSSFILMSIFYYDYYVIHVDNIHIPLLFAISSLVMFISGDLEYGPLTKINNLFLSNYNRTFGLSVISTVDSIMYILGSLIITVIYEEFGVQVSFIISGLILIFSVFFLKGVNYKCIR